MTPIFRRLAGLLGRTAESPAQQATPETTTGGGRRRGGRGRRGRGTATTTPTALENRTGNPDPARAAQSAGRIDNRSTSNGARGGSNNGSGPYGNSSYDRRRPARRRDLDQPLPEDVAFRPPAEGGDRSILPSRRRPPPGLRATKRVLLTGRRFVPRGSEGGVGGEDDAFLDLPQAPSVPDVANALPVAPPSPASLPGNGASPETAGEGLQRTGRRRRGRRGGRGRRRGGDSAATTSDDGA